MPKRDDRKEGKPERRSAEGVRIIGAEEAQKALDAGQAAGRRPEDQPRYGDVPPAPTGPRPRHRFPLPDSVNPAEAVPRSRVAPIKGESRFLRSRRNRTEPEPAAETEVLDEAALSGPDPADADYPVEDEYPEEQGDQEEDTGDWGAEEAVSPDPAEVPTGPLPAVGGEPPEKPAAYLEEPPAYEEDEEPEPAGYEPEPAPYENEPPAESVGGGWQAAVEGLAAGAGQSVGRETGSMPGSDEPDPYAWSRMEEHPGDEPPTSADPWSPTGQSEGQGWNLGEHTTEGPSYGEAPPEDRITLTGSHQLPHWSDPAPDVPPEDRDAEYESWEAIGAQARWRSEHDDWEDASGVHYLAGDEEPGGALDSDRGDRSDLYSFDEDFERLEEERSGTHPALSAEQPAIEAEEPAAEVPPVAIGSRPRRRPTPPTPKGRRAPAAAGVAEDRHDLTSRLAVGVGLVVLLVIAYALGPVALLVLAAAAVTACAAETYGILQRSGFRPATLLGLVATAGLMLAGYWRGMDALGLLLALTFAATMVWYLLGIVDARPLANVAVTAMAVLWVGFFGAFGSLMLRAHDGRGLFLGVVIVVIVSDIVAFLIGRQFGRHLLAPDVSPGKTVEGLIAGTIAALVVGALIGRELSPWGGLKHGLFLGILVAILAPIGDLFESLIKRDLNVKDSGTILGGHGGLLDRFDSLLLVLPGAYFLAVYLNILK